MIQSLANFIEEQRLRRAAEWFPHIHVEHHTRKWSDLPNAVGGTGSVSLVMHGFGVDQQTALGLLRLAEETGGSIRPNPDGGRMKALQLQFDEQETTA